MAKLVLHDWEDDVDIGLQVSVLHSSIEDFRMAYHLNRHCRLALKAANDIVLNTKPSGQSKYSVFHCTVLNSNIGLFLISNRSYASTNLSKVADLFSAEAETYTYLLPKFDKWDYILLSDNYEVLSKFDKSINEITASQIVDFKTFKITEQSVFRNYIYENEY
jgi:hypothetical protein